MKFYDIDQNYITYLKTIDNQIPDIKYITNNKFVCGIVLNMNGIDYYTPVSHTTQKQRTNLQIFDKGKPISSIRFSFMFPAMNEVLQIKNFKQIATCDQKYADLLNSELQWCIKNEEAIYNKAKSVYNIGCNKNHKLNYACCDFRKLEENYKKYLL